MEDRFPALFSMTIESATYNALQSSESDGSILARADLRLATRCYPPEEVVFVGDRPPKTSSEEERDYPVDTLFPPSRSSVSFRDNYKLSSCICCLIS